MKSILITAVTTTFVFALFLHFGNALVCYKCSGRQCTNNVTCSPGQDACIVVRIGGRNVSDCWKYSECNEESIEKHYQTGSFSYNCCTWDLCNDAPSLVSSKIVLGMAFLLIAARMLHF